MKGILITLLVIVILVVLIYCIYKWIRIKMTSTTVCVDSATSCYTVIDNDNKYNSANLLDEANRRVQLLIKNLKSEDHGLYQNNVNLLITRYRPDRLMENVSLSGTSYTVNKGDEVAMCVQERDAENKMVDINTLMFVLIHEVTHVGTKSIGHGEEFRLFFVYLLKKSVSLGIWNYIDYSRSPINYCGLTINTTPY